MGSSLGPAASIGRSVPSLPVPGRPAVRRSERYRVRGIDLVVSSDLGEPLDIVDATYSAFRVAGASAGPAGAGSAAFGLTDLGEGGPCLLETADGRTERLPDPGRGTIALLEALVGTVVAGLHRDGLYAVRAAP
jgi:hypothetical protein